MAVGHHIEFLKA